MRTRIASHAYFHNESSAFLREVCIRPEQASETWHDLGDAEILAETLLGRILPAFVALGTLLSNTNQVLERSVSERAA